MSKQSEKNAKYTFIRFLSQDPYNKMSTPDMRNLF